MAYKKGDSEIWTETRVREEHDLDPDETLSGEMYDSRADCNIEVFPIVKLPHSCDDWIIGGPEEVGQLIQDLQEALEKMVGD